MEDGRGVFNARGLPHLNQPFQRGDLGEQPVGVAWNRGKHACGQHACIAIEQEVTLSAGRDQHIEPHGFWRGAHKHCGVRARALDARELCPAQFTAKSRGLPHRHGGRGFDEGRGGVQFMRMRFSGLQHGHHGTVNRHRSVVCGRHNLQAIVSAQVAVHRHVFCAQDIVWHQLVAHEVEASTAKHGAAGRVVVQCHGHRTIGRHCGSSRVLKGL